MFGVKRWVTGGCGLVDGWVVSGTVFPSRCGVCGSCCRECLIEVGNEKISASSASAAQSVQLLRRDNSVYTPFSLHVHSSEKGLSVPE